LALPVALLPSLSSFFNLNLGLCLVCLVPVPVLGLYLLPLPLRSQTRSSFSYLILEKKELHIYTDGAARGNPGPGGYGVILMWGDKAKELSAGYRLTTNNRMELMAVIAALEALKKDGLNIVLHSDSQYVVKAVNEGWLKNWIATNFKGERRTRIYGCDSMNWLKRTQFASWVRAC
jgi:ribonuclease HI